MRLDDETLMAYADGELSPLEAKRVERAMADDPELARRVARFSATRRALKTAYDTVVSQPVPDHLLKLLEAIPDEPIAAPPIDLNGERTRRASRRVGPPVWACWSGALQRHRTACLHKTAPSPARRWAVF
jgi:anti-sigma factor RsiW